MSLSYLSPDQILLSESAERYFRQNYDFQSRQRLVSSSKGYDNSRWKEFAALGWLGLGLPERFGGLEGGVGDILALMKVFGKALAVEPHLSCVMLGARTILYSGSESHCKTLLPKIIGGELQVALAFAEPSSGYHLNSVETTARRFTDGFEIDGNKAVVLGAPSADLLIIPARTSGSALDRHGISLFLVSSKQAGVTIRGYKTIDGREAGEVSLNDVQVGRSDLLGELDRGLPILEQTVLAATLALLGEAQGAIEGALELTIDYLNTREQFGRKLSSYQALRHRVADMVAMREETAAMIRVAVKTFDQGDSGQCAEAVAAAKAFVCRYGIEVCKEAIQLHGAIAITDEFIVGHYLKRLVMIDRMFGDADQQIDIVMEKSAPLAGVA